MTSKYFKWRFYHVGYLLKLKLLIACLFLTLTSSLSIEAYGKPSKQLQTKCMAEAVYQEARGEPYKGKLAVGQVIMNRTKNPRFPNTVCDVIFQKHQFPWTKQFTRFTATYEYIILAEKIISGNHYLGNFKATHFHAKYVNPRWNDLYVVSIIGNHIFYKTKYERQYEKRYSSRTSS